MHNNAKFKLYQRVLVIAPNNKWYGRTGTVWQIHSYCVWVMFNPWVAPKNRKGVSLPVSFKDFELEPR